MKPLKRRNNDFDHGPWHDQDWVKENTKDLAAAVAFDNHNNHHKRRVPSSKSNTPHPRRFALKKHMSNRFTSSKHSSMVKNVRLVRTPDRDLPFLWSDENESDSNQYQSRSDEPLGKKDGPAQEKKIENHEQDFTPLRPSHRRLPSSPITPDEKASLDGDSIVDPEEELEYRRFLRGHPDSFDEEGYKVPINGFISPQTRKWNKQHKSRLEREAAAAQNTPSRPTRKSRASPSPEMPPPQTVSPDAAELAKEANGSMSNDLAPTKEHSEEEKIVCVSSAKEDASVIDTAKNSENVPETPAQLFASLRISDTVRATRTPKASLFSAAKTDRKTRHQKAVEEREAAKARDEYKMVPLGEKWDTRVRGAVRTGTSDDKYKPADFARCAPMYAGPGQDKWLSDVVINDYISLVAQHGNKNDRPTQVPTYVALSSYLYTKIYDQGPDKIPASWTRRKKILGKSLLDCEVIFIPINDGMHWTLCVVEPKTHRRITMYNSLGYGSNKRHAEAIHAWLEAHLGASYVADEWTVNWQGDSPQQANGHDCGVFTCTTARQIMLGQMEKHPYGAEIMPIQRKRMVAELLNGDLLRASES